ncbi:acetamidase/formamidase family protein [Bradyrhizobium sp. U87765 SZCCT0131]|uniref:acetamidase/formamidase family protein n=1 Tax=unclassified Bradyrhizobium TaxID=2631580 RepID=UPI001BAA76EE|nr:MULTISPECIES: acetamidase/formamidase family protein [unclassified Bradyrhizobium]MBR1222169.1 acetamidase/formamidase family protein [Bradyrhizobium sp. U87765 SZCCT0131]MBR1265702.1 acetamidase/formamidase family protein [Bradyrhizobium sp. U87765 SZCCT0134]MBR1307870.1 acetamidase/formamidase family protein [Bradyrhizobium sp. U87765 SZCCT0110]MBR1324020.1 acetamidase/formamidase family protein [Bradyrhizobium sp. U87765 SZCCT0109]MBR1348290.1 acetamidase/formamidase family protein [Brad
MTDIARADCCCTVHDPCPRHLAPAIAASAAGRAMTCEGVDSDALGATLDARGVSRRGAFRLAAASALFVGGGSAAIAAPPKAKEAPVFGRRPLGKVHELPSRADTVKVGAMDPATPVVLEIASGDVVHYSNTWVNWANEAKYGMPFEERESIRKRYPAGPYSLVGPVAVKGAEPGDIIECRMLRLKPIDWGWNSTPRGMGALPDDFDKPYLHYLRFDPARRYADFAEGVRLPLAPIQAVMAVQPAGDKPVSGILSGAYGGNICLSELVEGTSLFLAVEVAGGRIWTGDSHAAQGDGVVNQTAIETAMEDLRIQYVLHKKVPVRTPVAETPTHWITLGYGSTVDDALAASLRQMITWLSAATALSPMDIYALCSISGSFRITQYANQTKTVYTNSPLKAVHGMLPKAIFGADRLQQISRSIRPGG